MRQGEELEDLDSLVRTLARVVVPLVTRVVLFSLFAVVILSIDLISKGNPWQLLALGAATVVFVSRYFEDLGRRLDGFLATDSVYIEVNHAIQPPVLIEASSDVIVRSFSLSTSTAINGESRGQGSLILLVLNFTDDSSVDSGPGLAIQLTMSDKCQPDGATTGNSDESSTTFGATLDLALLGPGLRSKVIRETVWIDQESDSVTTSICIEPEALVADPISEPVRLEVRHGGRLLRSVPVGEPLLAMSQRIREK